MDKSYPATETMIEVESHHFPMIKPKNAKLFKMPKHRGSPAFAVESHILILRHQRVILDVDLAKLYGVTVKRASTSRSRATKNDFPPTLHFN